MIKSSRTATIFKCDCFAECCFVRSRINLTELQLQMCFQRKNTIGLIHCHYPTHTSTLIITYEFALRCGSDTFIALKRYCKNKRPSFALTWWKLPCSMGHFGQLWMWKLYARAIQVQPLFLLQWSGDAQQSRRWYMCCIFSARSYAPGCFSVVRWKWTLSIRLQSKGRTLITSCPSHSYKVLYVCIDKRYVILAFVSSLSLLFLLCLR